MYYRHTLDITYPERSDEHMLDIKSVREVKLDENYPYFPEGFGYKLLRGVYWVLVTSIVFPLMRLTHGLKIYGRENIKKHKAELKGGAITVSNHVFMWDYLAVLKAIRPHLAYFPAWRTNLESNMGGLVRMSGGIPVPTDSIHAMGKFNKAIEKVIEDGKWLHVFPEGSLWYFYPDIRPLKKAVFQYSAKYGKPVIPISMSFRDRRGLCRVFGKGPCVDLHIGEPIFPDMTLPTHEAAEKLRASAYHVMQVMNGINPSDPTYNTDHCINNYKKTM